jgi:hypothetical protein
LAALAVSTVAANPFHSAADSNGTATTGRGCDVTGRIGSRS